MFMGLTVQLYFNNHLLFLLLFNVGLYSQMNILTKTIPFYVQVAFGFTQAF